MPSYQLPPLKHGRCVMFHEETIVTFTVTVTSVTVKFATMMYYFHVNVPACGTVVLVDYVLHFAC